MYVTHAIDEIKLEKLKKENVSTIEIDLSKKSTAISLQELHDILVGESTEKKWVYNALANKYLKLFYSFADLKDITPRGCALHVDNCPIKMRISHGKPYANFIDDCQGCKYCISYQFNNGMLCSGRRRVSTIKDFSIPENERINISNKEIAESKRYP